MRNRLKWLTSGVVAIVLPLLSTMAVSQQDDSNVAFDPRDFSGVWVTSHEGTGGYRSLSTEEDIPERTPLGDVKFATTITGRSSDAYPIGIPPAFGNDPVQQCNPQGYPSIAFFGRPVEFFYARDRLMMLFEWQRLLREVWLDGRELPENPEPRWLGHSVGRWDGDTLVIDSIGFDERQWLDIYGNIISDEMRLQERWRRVGLDTLIVSYRLDDLKAYVEPWYSNTKIYRRAEPGTEIFEELCPPMDQLVFHETVRDRAGFGGASNAAVSMDREAVLDRFAEALYHLRRIRSAANEEWHRAASEEERTEIEDRAIEEITEAIRATEISFDDYQRTARLIVAEEVTREEVLERLAGLDEGFGRLYERARQQTD